ncbi:hypothetical protein G7Y79_00024g055600 [Physcia stellaris]|nr:hypothetical protein G7Y79_00024g055600 [Physcia stellaris]
MSLTFRVLWLLISISVTHAYPNQRNVLQQPTFHIEKDPRKPLWRNVTSQQVFSLKTNRIRTQWHDNLSLLKRGAPDAVSIHVDPHHLFAWTPIKLGVQQLGLMLDIGSTQFWVFASQNDSIQPSGLLPYTQLYVPGNSPSWQSIPNATFSSSYMAGFTATGIVGTESLTVGQLPPVRQHVGVMWYDKPVMDPQQIQGILGLGLSSDGVSGTMGTPTFLELLTPQLQAPLFTIALDEWGTGTWDFGHVDASKYRGSLRTVPVDDGCNVGGSWKVSGISVMFPEGKMAPANPCGMFDTGWDLINLDPSLVAHYYAAVPGATADLNPGTWTFPCSAPLPDLVLSIGGVDDCTGALQPTAPSGPAVFGQAFLMAQFAVFDIGGRRISFAPVAHV